MKKGQIWIETVLYTLIGIALIGVILAIATPKINQSRDRLLIEQTVKSLNTWDEKLLELLDRGPGNVRNIPAFTMKKGNLVIDGEKDRLVFVVDGLSKPYSEPGYPIREGNIVITSYQTQKSSYVELVLDYANVTNVTYGGEDLQQTFTSASTSYSFSLENLGGRPLTQINIRETSRG